MGQQNTKQVEEELPPHLRPIPISFDLPKAPYDDDDARYVKSFRMDQVAEYKNFFDEWGFVVVRDVLSDDEIEASIQDIWAVCCGEDVSTRDTFERLRDFASDDKPFVPVDRNDPTTWRGDCGWPSLAGSGILGGIVAYQRSAFANRQSENVYNVFSEILGRRDLMVSLDRFGVMRPTKNVLLKNGVDRQDFPNYKTRENWMHWDMNPFSLILPEEEKMKKRMLQDGNINQGMDAFFITENNKTLVNFQKLQGFVALSDSTEEDGGFLCVPKCHKIITDWAQANKKVGLDKKFANTDFVSVPERDPLCTQGQKITCRAGSLVIWDSRLAHCNYPNDSPNFRYVQYLKMFPREKGLPIFYENRKQMVEAYLKMSSFEPSDLGRKLFGLEDWQ